MVLPFRRFPHSADASSRTHTEDEPQRVKAVGGIGASTTISMVLGTVLGGVLAATGGLMLPLIAMPLMMLFGIIVLYRPLSTRIRWQPRGADHYFIL